MFLSNVSTEGDSLPKNRYDKVKILFDQYPQYLIAFIYVFSNILEFFTKNQIHKTLGAEKSSGYFVFSILGFFFLTIAQSGINLLSKKIVQLKKEKKEKHTYSLLTSLYAFNTIGCFLTFASFIGLNYAIFGRPEGILSLFLDAPETKKKGVEGVLIRQKKKETFQWKFV